MPVRTNEPRLPLEPEEYPLYRPPRRFGCSGLTVVTLLTLTVFGLLVWKVTPDMAKGLTDPLKKIFSSGVATAETTRGPSTLATQTAVAARPTTPPVVTPTAIIVYVQAGNNSGASIRVRSKPDSSASYSLSLKGGEILRVISTVDEKDKVGNEWRHVQLLCKDGRNGWVLAKFLISDVVPPPCP